MVTTWRSGPTAGQRECNGVMPMTGRKKGAHSFHDRNYTDKETEYLLACEKYKKAEKLGHVRLTDAFHVLTVILGYEQPS